MRAKVKNGQRRDFKEAAKREKGEWLFNDLEIIVERFAGAEGDKHFVAVVACGN